MNTGGQMSSRSSFQFFLLGTWELVSLRMETVLKSTQLPLKVVSLVRQVGAG